MDPDGVYSYCDIVQTAFPSRSCQSRAWPHGSRGFGGTDVPQLPGSRKVYHTRAIRVYGDAARNSSISP